MLCCTKSDTAIKAYVEKGLSRYEYNTLTATLSIANATVFINSGVTISNVRIKPMLTTDLSATYDDFEPYQDGGTVHIDSTTADRDAVALIKLIS